MADTVELLTLERAGDEDAAELATAKLDSSLVTVDAAEAYEAELAGRTPKFQGR